MNFVKFLRTYICKEHLWWLLLNVEDRFVEIAGMKELLCSGEEIWVAASVNYFVDRGLILRNICK